MALSLAFVRQLVGWFVLLYGLLLAVNTAAPAIAELTGEPVTASRQGECHQPLGKPPFGGIYGSCHAEWSGSDGGRLFGAGVADVFAWSEAVTAYRYPVFDDFAALAPSPRDQVAAMVAVLISTVGVLLLVSERRGRRLAREDSLVT